MTEGKAMTDCTAAKVKLSSLMEQITMETEQNISSVQQLAYRLAELEGNLLGNKVDTNEKTVEPDYPLATLPMILIRQQELHEELERMSDMLARLSRELNV